MNLTMGERDRRIFRKDRKGATMNRTFRAFLCAYAVALMVLAVGQGFEAHAFKGGLDSEAWEAFWLFIGAVSVSYAVLALGYLAGKDRMKAPAWPWRAALVIRNCWNSCADGRCWRSSRESAG